MLHQTWGGAEDSPIITGEGVYIEVKRGSIGRRKKGGGRRNILK